MCLGQWSLMKYVKDKDVLAVTRLDDVEGEEEKELEDDWDRIM
jgi:hypothetical protein